MQSAGHVSNYTCVDLTPRSRRHRSFLPENKKNALKIRKGKSLWHNDINTFFFNAKRVFMSKYQIRINR